MADETQEREWTLWNDQRTPNASGSFRFRATFPLLGLTVTAEWTEEQRLCGMGYGESEWWPMSPCYWNGYRRYITNDTLEWSPLQAYDPEQVVWTGLDLLPCPFSGKPPKIEPEGQYIGAPLWRSEAMWISSPGVPKRRWLDAKAMQASWNTRAPPQPTANTVGSAAITLAEGCVYRSQGYAMATFDQGRDADGAPMHEVWGFADEDSGSEGYGYLELRIHEIVQTENSGVLAVYYRQWFAPDGEPAFGRQPRRRVGSLASVRALIGRRKMEPVT